MRGQDFDDALDRQMHDTFDPERQTPMTEQTPPAEPRKRDWHNVGTRVRTARLSDPLWDAVKAEAEKAGVPTSTVVRDALDAYLDRRP